METARLSRYIARGLVCMMAMLALAGCMAIKGNQLAELGPLPSINGDGFGTVQVTAVCTSNGKPLPDRQGKRNSHILMLATNAVQETGMFERIVTTNIVHEIRPDYLLQYEIDNYGNQALAAISGFICGYSFFTIPGGAVDHWRVRTTLQDSKNNVISDKSYEDKMTAIMWLPLLPACCFRQCRIGPVCEDVLLNIYRHSLKDIAGRLVPLNVPTNTHAVIAGPDIGQVSSEGTPSDEPSM